MFSECDFATAAMRQKSLTISKVCGSQTIFFFLPQPFPPMLATSFIPHIRLIPLDLSIASSAFYSQFPPDFSIIGHCVTLIRVTELT